MNLTISGHHLEVTPALRNYVTTKLDRITRHFDQVVDVRVLLTVEKKLKEKERRQRAECKIHVKGNDMFEMTGDAIELGGHVIPQSGGDIEMVTADRQVHGASCCRG